MKSDKRTSSPPAAGGDEEIAPPTVKFLPYADRLSSEAHLWAEKRADTSTMEDIQYAQINPSAAPATYLHPHPYLHELQHLLLCLHAYVLSLPHARSILPATRPPLHCCFSEPDRASIPSWPDSLLKKDLVCIYRGTKCLKSVPNNKRNTLSIIMS